MRERVPLVCSGIICNACGAEASNALANECWHCCHIATAVTIVDAAIPITPIKCVCVSVVVCMCVGMHILQLMSIV